MIVLLPRSVPFVLARVGPVPRRTRARLPVKPFLPLPLAPFTIYLFISTNLNLSYLSYLLTSPPSSLDNVCAEPKPTDSRYLDILHKTYSRHQDFPRTQPKDMVSPRLLRLLRLPLRRTAAHRWDGGVAARSELSGDVVGDTVVFVVCRHKSPPKRCLPIGTRRLF